MNIGFDMDGVLCKIDVALLRVLDNLPEDVRATAEEWYYRQREPLLDARLFLAPQDQMFIITSRPERLLQVTKAWVRKFYPFATLEFAHHDTIEKGANSQSDVSKWLIAKQVSKAYFINYYKIDVYFDDDNEVDILRKHCPKCKIIKYGERI